MTVLKRTGWLDSPAWYSVFVLGVFLLALELRALLRQFEFYRALFETYSYHVPNALVNVLWIVLCIAALMVAYRSTPWAAVKELGLAGPVVPALGLGFVASLPMLAGIAVASTWSDEATLLSVAHLCVISPVAEEVLFRGYAFRQLYRRAGWRFLPAVLVTAAVFAAGHVVGGSGAWDPMQMLATLAITFVGGLLFAWLFIRWDDNLWVPAAVHVFFNLWWELFAVDEGPVGGIAANAGRALAIAAMIALTIYRRRIPWRWLQAQRAA
jgi:membrane protease YdiL (CAAX protease family)